MRLAFLRLIRRPGVGRRLGGRLIGDPEHVGEAVAAIPGIEQFADAIELHAAPE
uniref:hypothetical protein n=1 Tax=Nocardia cyriacigeorgica TaxID=135487 RepID=UPI0039E7118B